MVRERTDQWVSTGSSRVPSANWHWRMRSRAEQFGAVVVGDGALARAGALEHERAEVAAHTRGRPLQLPRADAEALSRRNELALGLGAPGVGQQRAEFGSASSNRTCGWLGSFLECPARRLIAPSLDRQNTRCGALGQRAPRARRR
jgi:hypothetical protein